MRHLPPLLLEHLAGRIAAAAPVEEILVFGSRARGDAAEDSDLDLLVIYDGTVAPDRWEVAKAVRAAAHPFPVTVDVLVVPSSRLAEDAARPNHVVAVALTEGRGVWSRKRAVA
jgi:predicted nucleotidyltransferase